MVKSQRKNLQEKYGVINTGQIPEVIDKMQKHIKIIQIIQIKILF